MTKIKDGIIGHAVGDAMGVPVEFVSRKELMEHPVTTMIGYGSHPVPEGYWSDDTTMEIALIDSFIRKRKFDYDDIMLNFSKWINDGEFTPGGELFDIGRTCLTAVRRYCSKETSALESGLDTINANGNGSLMRILPVAYYCYYHGLDDKKIYELVKNISSLTHRHEISILGCYIYTQYILCLLNESNKYESYERIKKLNYSFFSSESLQAYERILIHNIKNLNIDEIHSSGYVVDTLEASLWVILNTDSYEDAIIQAINLGDDTDTTGAVVGSIAGIIYGYDQIPNEWLIKLAKRDYLEDLCNQFEKVLKN